MKIKAIQNQEGFTLVEMLVVSAILSVLMLGFSGYMFQQVKQTKMVETKQNYGQLKNSVIGAASDPSTLSSSETLQYTDL